jgi:hypothetical protein
MRLVTVSATGVGDVAWERRAAAAAALDRLALESRLRTKAVEAASEAEADEALGSGALWGACRQGKARGQPSQTLQGGAYVRDWTPPCAGGTLTWWIRNYGDGQMQLLGMAVGAGDAVNRTSSRQGRAGCVRGDVMYSRKVKAVGDSPSRSSAMRRSRAGGGGTDSSDKGQTAVAGLAGC